jgi:hypothetical protein
MLAKAGALLLESHLQSICSVYFGDGGLSKYFPELASKCSLPDLCLLSS